MKEITWQGIPVEAGPDCIFDWKPMTTDLVVIGQGYRPFPGEELNDLLYAVIEKWGITPERFLVTGQGIYAVMAKSKAEVRDDG